MESRTVSRQSSRPHSQTKGTVTGSGLRLKTASSIFSLETRKRDSFSAILRATSSGASSATGVRLQRNANGNRHVLPDHLEALLVFDHAFDCLDRVARLDDEVE